MCVGEYLFLKIDCRVKVKVWIIGRVYRLVYGYVIMYGRDEMEQEFKVRRYQQVERFRVRKRSRIERQIGFKYIICFFFYYSSFCIFIFCGCIFFVVGEGYENIFILLLMIFSLFLWLRFCFFNQDILGQEGRKIDRSFLMVFIDC